MPHTYPIGHFVLADISGYSAYLSEVELEHANGVLRDLLELLVGALTPPLSLVSLAGDSLFAYCPAADLARGETLLELLEAAYQRFRTQQQSIARRTTCGCQACAQISQLDLKFIVHSGAYHLHRLAGHLEPLGLAASLVRSRALKPPPDGATRGYALFSAESLARLDLPAGRLGGQPLTIDTGEAGRLETYRLDLNARYAAAQAARRTAITAEAAHAVVVRDLPAAPATVWDWLNDPARRSQWTAGRTWHAGERPQGRTGPGARNHCDHGLGQATETVLDWQPFDHFTVELVQRGGRLVIRQTYQLEPLAGGQQTRLHCHIQFQPPLPRWLARPMGRLSGRQIFKPDLKRLAVLLAAEAQQPELGEVPASDPVSSIG